ncbi:MAG: hypothetical protein A2Z55_05010 [Burkholderiales bacterium RIFCSPHIGHO2_12_63_9]|jgi:hypothetical protein|nr:MAG: hypothetical protein A2Z55_05010 [Burkholderiales bacterium RIFCSPHIGHO2_12_63_9]
MIHIRKTLIGICVATASMGVLAQGAEEHKEHHPEGAAPATAAKKAPGQSIGPEKMAAMDQRMKDMQAMHEKMMSAKTPEERQALMAEHMKMMQDGMAMMKQMGGMSKMGGMQGGKGMGGMSERHQMMEKRMEMMESMMQMMMDRMQSPMAPAAK